LSEEASHLHRRYRRLDQFQRVIKVAHQCGAGLTAGHVAGRTAHIDIDDVGARGFGDPRALRHPAGFAARELNDMRAYSGCLAAQTRHRTTVDKIVAGGHFRNHKAGAKGCRQTSKGCVGDAGHGREKNPVGDLNIAYFQRLRAWCCRAGHGFLIFTTSASSRLPRPILRTNLVQSSFLPTL
jgi:hypothetical protein